MTDVKKDVKEFILKEFLPGAEAEELLDDTPLISGGILDSLATLKLVSFLEEKYGIEIAPYEADDTNLATVVDIENLVMSKL
jgi:acyl carrier protein